MTEPNDQRGAMPDDLDAEFGRLVEEELAPFDESELNADRTSEMSRLRPSDMADDPLAAAVEHDVEALLAERDSLKDIALRLQADFENFRKRVAAQTESEVQRATGRMAEALLPVLDAVEAAFLQHPAEIEPVLNLLLGEVRKLGLETLDLHGQPFDPNLAEAVLHEAGEGESVVVEVLRSGYTWKGRVLRPAMVKVRG